MAWWLASYMVERAIETFKSWRNEKAVNYLVCSAATDIQFSGSAIAC